MSTYLTKKEHFCQYYAHSCHLNKPRTFLKIFARLQPQKRNSGTKIAYDYAVKKDLQILNCFNIHKSDI